MVYRCGEALADLSLDLRSQAATDLPAMPESVASGRNRERELIQIYSKVSSRCDQWLGPTVHQRLLALEVT